MADKTVDEVYDAGDTILHAAVDTTNDKILIWDDSAGKMKAMTLAEFLQII
jgi:hypothetical protein